MDDFNELKDIIDNEDITTLFQPVIHLKNGKILGYEALSRGPSNSSLYNPLDLLRTAEKYNMLWDLELLFRKKAIEKSNKLKENGLLLFLNVDPKIINDEKFTKGFTKDILSKYNLSPDSIIFEITERTAISDYKRFRLVLDNYKNQGYMIAIDDAGAGYSGMKTIKETRPHYIKIDMDLIRGVDKDTFKQAIIRAFVNLSVTTNIKLIAEGIETKEELETLINLGVYAGQGYFIKKPVEYFSDISKEIIDLIQRFNSISSNVFNYSDNYHYIGNILEERKTFTSNVCSEDVQRYLDEAKVSGVCICDNNYPVGLVMKYSLNSELAKQYGFAVYSRRPISLVMDTKPLIVDYYTPINQVSELAMTREDMKTYDNIIVTLNGKYSGIVSVKKLLQYATSLEKNYARELNPLTQLPGNVIINRVLNDIISYGNKCCILYIDLDNFKAFNDVYGFENGDKMIKLTANILNEQIKSKFPINSFVGHIGGDDFVCLIENGYHEIECLCKEIIFEFDSKKLDFFLYKDLKNNFIVSEDKEGNKLFYNLTTISVAGIYGNPKIFQSVDELALHMGKIKKKVKKVLGSSFIIENHDDVETEKAIS